MKSKLAKTLKIPKQSFYESENQERSNKPTQRASKAKSLNSYQFATFTPASWRMLRHQTCPSWSLSLQARLRQSPTMTTTSSTELNCLSDGTGI
ncbi:hypothetical protein HK096_010424, partial [Nowakowskiella sp. JEL0078]